MKTDYSKKCESLDNFRWKVQNIQLDSDGYRGSEKYVVILSGHRNGPVPAHHFMTMCEHLESMLNPKEAGPKSLFGLRIKNVIFNDPATIVIWNDDSKTVVKTQNGEEFDPEKGLAMAIAKRMFGNTGSYFEEFKKWLPECEEKCTCANCKYYNCQSSECSIGKRVGLNPELVSPNDSCTEWEERR